MRRALIATLFTLCVLPACLAQQPRGLLDLASFPKTKLEIHSSKQTYAFDIWLAQTQQQQEQGLMFVRDLPPDRGMLFIAEQPRVFTMWMKNTYIPLDMVFIDKDGRIAKIAAETTPHSLAIVSSEVPVTAILELKGGEAARRALHKGDRVNWNAPKT